MENLNYKEMFEYLVYLIRRNINSLELDNECQKQSGRIQYYNFDSIQFNNELIDDNKIYFKLIKEKFGYDC